jgi:glutaredoxin 3
MKAEIYTKTHCPYCTKAKALLISKGIEYKEYMVTVDATTLTEGNATMVTREQLLERIPTARTVPQIWLDGQHIGGYTELEKYFAKI